MPTTGYPDILQYLQSVRVSVVEFLLGREFRDEIKLPDYGF